MEAGKNGLTEMLRPHVADLMHDAGVGDRKARNVIAFYEMHRTCPSDRAAPALCEYAFNDWIHAKKEATK